MPMLSSPRFRATRDKSSGGIRLMGTKLFLTDLTKRSNSNTSCSRRVAYNINVRYISSGYCAFYLKQVFGRGSPMGSHGLSTGQLSDEKYDPERTSRQTWDLAASVWPHLKVEIRINRYRGTIPHRHRWRGTLSYWRKMCSKRLLFKRPHLLLD